MEDGEGEDEGEAAGNAELKESGEVAKTAKRGDANGPGVVLGLEVVMLVRGVRGSAERGNNDGLVGVGNLLAAVVVVPTLPVETRRLAARAAFLGSRLQDAAPL